jgi:hypothetical protein
VPMRSLTHNRAQCLLCKKRMPEDEILMTLHLIEFHPLELARSKSFHNLFGSVAQSAYNAGEAIAKKIRGVK